MLLVHGFGVISFEKTVPRSSFHGKKHETFTTEDTEETEEKQKSEQKTLFAADNADKRR
jgi:hypothetical protein